MVIGSWVKLQPTKLYWRFRTRRKIGASWRSCAASTHGQGDKTEEALPLEGFQAFQHYLKANSKSFRGASTLLILGDKEDSAKEAANAIALIQFTMAQKMGYRTIVSQQRSNTPPTKKDLDSILHLASRSGIENVVAVGPSYTLQLAKAFLNAYHESSNRPLETIVLIPTTYEAALSSTLLHPLLLDTKEETYVPYTTESEHSQLSRPKVVALEQTKMDPGDVQNAVLSTLFFSLESLIDGDISIDNYSGPDISFQRLGELLSADTVGPADHDLLVSLLVNSGRRLRFGLSLEDSRPRSRSLAIASSLLPCFPDQNILSITAGLFPSFLAEDGVRENIDRYMGDSTISLIKSKSPLLLFDSTPIDELLSQIRQNRFSWNCLDEPEESFRSLLNKHVLL